MKLKLLSMCLFALSWCGMVQASLGYVRIDNGVLVIESDTNEIVATIAVPGSAFDPMAITSDGSILYVSSDTVLQAVDLETNTLIGVVVNFGDALFSSAIALTPDDQVAYIARSTFGGPDSELVVVDLVAKTIVKRIDTNTSRAEGVAITHDGLKGFVSTFNPPSVVRPIDTATNTLGAPIPVGTGPAEIVINSTNTLAYVVNAGSFPGLISIIDVPANTSSETISTPAVVNQLALTSDDQLLYAKSDSEIYVIDTTTNTITATILIEGGAAGDIALTPDNAFLYVTVSDGTIRVFDTSNNEPVATIAAGSFPFTILFAPAALAPQNAKATIATNMFLNKTECIMRISWDAVESTQIASYRLYNNGILLASTPATGPLLFTVCLNNRLNINGFAITSVTARGTESDPTPVIIV